MSSYVPNLLKTLNQLPPLKSKKNTHFAAEITIPGIQAKNTSI